MTDPKPSLDETAWLIEHLDRYPVPKWMMARGGHRIQWTTDAFKALRFASEEECRKMIRYPDFHDDLYKMAVPTEHVFVDGPATPDGKPARDEWLDESDEEPAGTRWCRAEYADWCEREIERLRAAVSELRLKPADAFSIGERALNGS